MSEENKEVNSAGVDVGQIQKEFYEELNERKESEKKPNDVSGNGDAPVSRWDTEDFISDDVMAFVLGCKNSAIISILAKELGKTAKEMLSDLYEVSDKELKIYKKSLQTFVRETFPEYVDKIAKVTNGELVAIMILELGRWHEAKILIQADKDRSSKEEK